MSTAAESRDGGADPGRGTGMVGLMDRVHALGGTIDIASPVGTGTSLQVTVPLDAGYFRMPGGSIRANRWVPWVLLRSKQTGSEFYAMSIHFKSGDDRPGRFTYFRIRETQAARMVSKARALANHGRTVYAGGDFNSTSNTLPYNGVHRAFMNAGFYDGFSAETITNGQYPTTNGFRFPVKEQPYRRDYVLALHPKDRGDASADRSLGGSYAFSNRVYNTRSSVTSDHFMQSAVMPVKSGPY